MRVLVLLACSVALGVTIARAQVNGPTTISPHDDTQWTPPSSTPPEPHAAAPTSPDAGTPSTAKPASPPASAAAPSPAPAPPAASLAPPAATPTPRPRRPRQAIQQAPIQQAPGMPPDTYGGPDQGQMPEFPQGRPHGLRARFEAENVTHDGRLTPEQAMMGMPGVARHFAEIDRDNRGYVTMQEIRAWRRARRHRNMMPEPGMPSPGMPGPGTSGPAMPGPAPEPGGPDQEQ